MKTVYKYPLLLHTHGLMLPKGAQVLSVIEQYGGVVLYALVEDTETRTEPLSYQVCGTGHSVIVDGYEFINTVSLQGGTFILHVFTKWGER